MNTSVARQTSFAAMVAFSILLYMYYLRGTEWGEKIVHLFPASKLYDGRKMAAIQRVISSVDQNGNQISSVFDNLKQRDILKLANISTHNIPLEMSNTTVGVHTDDHFNAEERLPLKENAILSKSKSTCVKQIQFWGYIKMKLPEGEYDCPAENCKARFVQSSSYERLLTSHAVILHHKGSWKWKELARYRPDGQMWIYMTKESPLRAKKARSPDPERLAFNWTMTYRRDSDFVIPYGRYTEDISEVPADDNRNWATGKTRLIAWMASNCDVTSWGRTKFVKSLKNLIQVDTYGACGTLECPRDEKCYQILSSHKFYLALENSQCEDYITEKFWKNAFTNHLVPIVYGTSREDYEKVAPPNSFIHVSDFVNRKSFIEYIKYLDNNDTAYNKYFEWRKRGTVSWYSATMALSPKMLCDITKRVKDTNTLQPKEYSKKSKNANMMSVWSERSCKHLHMPNYLTTKFYRSHRHP